MTNDSEALGVSGGFCSSAPDSVAANGSSVTVDLGEHPLRLDDIRAVARRSARVTIAPAVRARLETARAAVLERAASGESIYGLTSALGANTGKLLKPDGASSATQASSDSFSQYQINALRARSVGVGSPFPTDTVRAIMFARLAGMRIGGSGISPSVFEALTAMLNAAVHPVMPSLGSISVADLAPLSAMALPLIGEGRAEYRGAEMDGADALAAAGLEAATLGPKDGLSLISSNAATIGAAAMMLIDVRDAFSRLEHAAALAFEGFRGNLGPLDPRIHAARPAPGQGEAAARMLSLLEGSALVEPGAARRVQDPLSFRCIAQVHGAALGAWDECRRQIEVELNAAADSPLLLDSGEMLSNGNFHIPALAIALEALGLALTQCAAMSVERSVKLLSPSMTALPLHLTLHGPAHSGFATVQKTLTALYNRMRHLANPCCLDFLPVSERIEDHATMAMNVVDKTRAMIEPLAYLAAIEALIGAQAVDLRGSSVSADMLGRGARSLHTSLRSRIPMLDHDRPLGADIEIAADVLHHLTADAR